MTKINWKDPEQVKAYRREYDRKRREDPEYRKKKNEYARFLYMIDPEYRARCKKRARESYERKMQREDTMHTMEMMAAVHFLGEYLNNRKK